VTTNESALHERKRNKLTNPLRRRLRQINRKRREHHPLDETNHAAALLSGIGAVATLGLATFGPGIGTAQAEGRCDPVCHGTWCPGEAATLGIAQLVKTWDQSGPLGLPISDVNAVGDLQVSTFEHGKIELNPTTGQVAVTVNDKVVPSGL
jgi:hypothetical protein